MAAVTTDATPTAGWYPDPARKHQLRWWAGAWSEHVADRGKMSVDAVPPVLPLPAWACYSASELTVEHRGPYATRDWPMAANGAAIARVRVPGDGSAHLLDARAGVVVFACSPVANDDRTLVSDTFGRVIGEIDPAGLGAPVALRSGTEVVGWVEEYVESAPAGRIVRAPDGAVAARFALGAVPFDKDPSKERQWWSARIEPVVSGSLRALVVAALLALAQERI